MFLSYSFCLYSYHTSKFSYIFLVISTISFFSLNIVESVTKYAVTVMEPNDIKYILEKAVYMATSGRTGTTWVDIPLDVQSAEIDPDELKGFEPEVYEKPAEIVVG